MFKYGHIRIALHALFDMLATKNLVLTLDICGNILTNTCSAIVLRTSICSLEKSMTSSQELFQHFDGILSYFIIQDTIYYLNFLN